MNLVITEDGNVHGVYSDTLAKANIGDPIVRRASEVEYNHVRGQWEATELRTGQIIASGPERNKVIEEEVRILNQRLADLKPDEPLHFHCDRRCPPAG